MDRYGKAGLVLFGLLICQMILRSIYGNVFRNIFVYNIIFCCIFNGISAYKCWRKGNLRGIFHIVICGFIAIPFLAGLFKAVSAPVQPKASTSSSVQKVQPAPKKEWRSIEDKMKDITNENPVAGVDLYHKGQEHLQNK